MIKRPGEENLFTLGCREASPFLYRKNLGLEKAKPLAEFFRAFLPVTQSYSYVERSLVQPFFEHALRCIRTIQFHRA